MGIIGMPQNYEGELDADCLMESERIKSNVERFRKANALVEKRKAKDFKSGKDVQNKQLDDRKTAQDVGGDGEDSTDLTEDRGDY